MVPLGDDLFRVEASCTDDVDTSPELRNLRVKVKGHPAVPVVDGQVIEWEGDDDNEIGYGVDGTLEVEASKLKLKAKCVDEAGNTTKASETFQADDD